MKGYKMYDTKIIKSGNVTEIYSYIEENAKKLEFTDKQNKSVKKKSKKHEEKEKQELKGNETYCRRLSDTRQTRRKIERLINANIGQYDTTDKFLTLTFAEEPKDRQEVIDKFNIFKQKFQYHYKDKFEYIAVIERGHKGTERLHIHAVIFNLPFIKTADLAMIWKYGWVKINKTYGVHGAAKYLLKYLDKTLESGFIEKGKRFYFPSKGLKKPEVLYLNEDEKIDYMLNTDLGELEFAVSFESYNNGEGCYQKFILDDGINADGIDDWSVK